MEEETTPVEPIDLLSGLDPEEMRKLLADCNSKFDSAAKARKPYEAQWYLNTAFYLGKQYVVEMPTKALVNGNSFALHEAQVPKWGVKLTANKIMPMVRNELTKLTKEEIQGFVVPNTNEESDLAAARAAEAITEHMFNSLEINRIRSAASLWACLSGNGFVKCWVDPNQLDLDGLPGRILVDSINPFHLYFGDLSVDTVEKQPFIIHAQTSDPDEVEAIYGEKLTPDCVADNSNVLEKLKNMINSGDAVKDKIHLREMWIKPNYKYPEGAVITFTSSKILRAVPWFYAHGQYPFLKLDHIPLPDRFYAESIVTQSIVLQKEYNKVRSQLLENKNRMSRPQLIAPKGSIDPRKVTSEPGLVIEYTPGFAPPTILPVAQTPSYVLQEQDRILKDLDDVSGQYEITKGRTPPGVEAASAIAYLQEENDSRMYHTIASLERLIASLGRQLLSHVGQFWDEARIVRTISTNNSYEARKFKGADLRGNLDYRVEAGSMAPRSKAARQAFVTELMKMGAIPPDKGLKYLQMSETNRLFMELQIDQRQAERENDRMREAQPPIADPQEVMMNPEAAMLQPLPINVYDNHQVHRDVHANFMKTQEYELLPEENKGAILEHFNLHETHLQMQMQQQAMMGMPNG